MKLLHFKATAGADEYFVPAKNVNLINVSDNASVRVHVGMSDDTNADVLDSTVTATTAASVASRLAQEIAQGDNDVFVVTDLADVSAVAFVAGT